MKLTQLPQKAHVREPVHHVEEPVVVESIEAADPEINPGVYGIDSSTPEGKTAAKRLASLRKTDPALYARITSLD